MKCPNCGSDDISVKDTMHGPDGKIYRRRRCNECGDKFRSVEEIAEDTEDFRNAYAAAHRAKSDLLRMYHEYRKGRKEQ